MIYEFIEIREKKHKTQWNWFIKHPILMVATSNYTEIMMGKIAFLSYYQNNFLH